MKGLIIVLGLLFCLGCTSYQVGVNGFSTTGDTLQIPRVSSICVVKDSNTPNPILEKEIGMKIQRLLNSKGYSIETHKADYYLLFEYGIDSGRTVTGTTPVYHSGGTATAHRFGSYGGSSFTTIQAPGYTTYVPYSKTVYTRWLVLKLIDGNDYRSSQKIEPLWIGEVTSTGSSSDLRKVINYMLIPAFEHFGANTGERLYKEIFKGDKRVKALVQD